MYQGGQGNYNQTYPQQYIPYSEEGLENSKGHPQDLQVVYSPPNIHSNYMPGYAYQGGYQGVYERSQGGHPPHIYPPPYHFSPHSPYPPNSPHSHSVAPGTLYIPPGSQGHPQITNTQESEVSAEGNRVDDGGEESTDGGDGGDGGRRGTAPGSVPVTVIPTLIQYGTVFPLQVLDGQYNTRGGWVGTGGGDYFGQFQYRGVANMKMGPVGNGNVSRYGNVSRSGRLGSGRGGWGGNYGGSRGRGRGRSGYYYNGGGGEIFDVSNEQNRGPRSLRGKQGVNVNRSSLPEGLDIQDINRSDFDLSSLGMCRFFVIKSYSEDDVHKSIKYSVWASTVSGNQKLDSAYKLGAEQGKDDATQEEKEENRPTEKYRVFLFFSVNASGQFCGVAEMIGPVEYGASCEHWQQDKWTGLFPVRWHFIKDVPNNQLRHILLANNEDKPVTNSRDTQEVIQDEGFQILQIFKDFPSRTSILDDFEFYDQRQVAMQQKREKIKAQKAAAIEDSVPTIKSVQPIEKEANGSTLPSEDFLESTSSGDLENGAEEVTQKLERLSVVQ